MMYRFLCLHHRRIVAILILCLVNIGSMIMMGKFSSSFMQVINETPILSDGGRMALLQNDKDENVDNHHSTDAQKQSNLTAHLTIPSTIVTTGQQYTAILDLLPWEEASKTGQCKGPSSSGVSRTTEGSGQACCPGSVSSGGAVKYLGAKCRGDMFDRVAAAARTYLAHDSYDENTYTACDACGIIDLMIMHNWTLSFSGDSMMRQNFVGLQCEIMRRVNSKIINNTDITAYRIQVLPSVKWPRDPKTFWRRGIHGVYEVRIYHANKNHQQGENNDNYARILFFAQYRPLDGDNSELEYIAQQSDIILFDHGLHYLTHMYKDMIERTRTMLPALGGNDVKLVAWRETSSQHFNTSHGEYVKDITKQGCHPIRQNPSTTRADNMIKAAKLANWTVAWADNAAFSTTPPPYQQLAKSRGVGGNSSNNSSSNSGGDQQGVLGELVILPFRNFTHDLHYMHGAECTHYCSSPHLWLPIWRSLRLSMDRLSLSL
jgi:hypothetical protein